MILFSSSGADGRRLSARILRREYFGGYSVDFDNIQLYLLCVSSYILLFSSPRDWECSDSEDMIDKKRFQNYQSRFLFHRVDTEEQPGVWTFLEDTQRMNHPLPPSLLDTSQH